MPEFSFSIESLTIFSLDENTYIDIAKGSVRDSMSRGSYRSSEVFTERRRLFYRGLIEGKHCFSDAQVSLYATVIRKPSLALIFEPIEGYNRLWLYLNGSPKEHIYGCGEQFTTIDLKGKTVPIWVSEHHSARKLIHKFLRERFKGVDYDHLGNYQEHASYYAQPTFMSSLCYAVHVTSKAYARFTFKETKTILYFREIPQRIDFFKAKTFVDLAARLNRYLGLQRPLPDWTAEGVILAIQGGTKVIEQKLEDAHANGINVKAVWAQDWSGQTVTKFGEQVYWNWTADDVRYTDLSGFIARLKERGIYFLGYMNPFLKVASPQYCVAKEQGFLVKRKNGKPYHVKSTTFKAGIIDLTHPKAYDWWKSIIKTEMLDCGFAGWMADFGEYLPTDAVLYQGDAALVHNQYPELWAKCHQEAISENKSDAFIFTRAAFTETLRETNAMWIGDQHVDFSDQYGIGSVIPAYVSMAVSGIGINHSDTGGYTTLFHMRRSQELFIRWAEMNVFSPLFRTHEGNLPKRNAQYDDPTIVEAFGRLSRLYKKLSFYHHHVRDEYYQKGLPTIRPLFYHFNEAFAFTTKRHYMYGESLLVCPVLRPGVTTHRVELPKGRWIHLITKAVFDGGNHIIDAPLGMPMAFYLESSPFKEAFDAIVFD